MNTIKHYNTGTMKEKNLPFINYIYFNILLPLLHTLLHHFLHLSGIMNNAPSLFGMDPRSSCLCLEKWVKYFYGGYMINLYKIFFLAIHGKYQVILLMIYQTQNKDIALLAILRIINFTTGTHFLLLLWTVLDCEMNLLLRL